MEGHESNESAPPESAEVGELQPSKEVSPMPRNPLSLLRAVAAAFAVGQQSFAALGITGSNEMIPMIVNKSRHSPEQITILTPTPNPASRRGL